MIRRQRSCSCNHHDSAWNGFIGGLAAVLLAVLCWHYWVAVAIAFGIAALGLATNLLIRVGLARRARRTP